MTCACKVGSFPNMSPSVVEFRSVTLPCQGRQKQHTTWRQGKGENPIFGAVVLLCCGNSGNKSNAVCNKTHPNVLTKFSKKFSYRRDSARCVKRPFKVTQRHPFCANRRVIYDFLFYAICGPNFTKFLEIVENPS